MSLTGKNLDVPRARDWLLRQGEFVVRHAELHWIDERAGTAPLTLRDLQFVLRNGLRSHALRLDATPPPHWGQRFSLRARFTQPLLARPGELQRWSGTLFADFPQVDAAALRRQLSLPFDLAEGDGALRAWVDIVDGSVRKATADFALRAVALQLAPTLQPSQPSQPSQPLRLQQLLGRVALARDASGIELRLRQLAAAAPADRAAPPWSIGDVRLSWQQAQDLQQRWTRDTPVTGGEFSADALDLRSLGPLIDALPADAALRERLAGLAPSGHARQPVNPRPPREPHKHGLGLILKRMAKRNGVQPQFLGPPREQIVPCPARAVRKVAAAVPAAPLQCHMRHTKRRTTFRHRRRLCRRVWPQAMIDGRNCQLWPALAPPIGQQVQQRH